MRFWSNCDLCGKFLVNGENIIVVFGKIYLSFSVTKTQHWTALIVPFCRLSFTRESLIPPTISEWDHISTAVRTILSSPIKITVR